MINISTAGHLLLYSALSTALLQCLFPLHGYFRKNTYTLMLARPLALVQCFLVANAFFLLIIAFLINDFSIFYVTQNSHPSLPFFYRLTAVWSAHEGSFLLWIFLLDVWTVAVCFWSRHWETEMQSLTLSLLGLIIFCFLLFLYYTSNPFTAAMSIAPQDLNPLLQDPGFFIHPPMLYAGYVGFSAAFCITIASLISGKQQQWAHIVRPWVLAAWSFLTIGITLGSWWAYHVLGWGGFWFWDPVENASLLPWLTGTALLHLVIVVEKEQRFLHWGIILAILTFSLSILGTFLVRSGILISVHSFASDPSRGLFLLLLLAFITGSAFIIYFLTLYQSKPTSNRPQKFFWSSREGMLLIQTFLLFTSMATVLLGTLYPLIIEASGLGALSVGAPYFNHALYPLLILGLIVMGWAPLSEWQHKNEVLFPYTWRYLFISVSFAILLTLFFARQWNPVVICNLSAVFWVMLSLKPVFLRQTAMAIAHLGFAIIIMSIVLSSAFSTEREVRMETGEQVALGPYIFHFINTEEVDGANFKGIQGNFLVTRRDKPVITLKPEKRIYRVRQMTITKVDIYPAIFHDLYIALGEPLSENAWSVRLYYKPFIRWIWIGGFLIALGGGVALSLLIRPLGTFSHKGRRCPKGG